MDQIAPPNRKGAQSPGGRSVCAALTAALAAAHAVAMVSGQPPAGFGGLAGVPDKDFTTGIFLRAAFRPADYTLTDRRPDVGPGGTVTVVDVDSNRVLGATASATSQFFYALQPCGFVSPGVQPASSQTVTPLNAPLDIGFVDELGGLVRNRELEMSRSFLIPQGLASYIANPSCTEEAFAIAIFSTPDPNPALVLTSLVNLPVPVVRAMLPMLSAEDVLGLRADVAAGDRPLLQIDPECAAACGLVA